MPSLTTWAPFCAVVLPMWTTLSPWSKQSHGCSCQGCKATNHTGLRNLGFPAYTGTLRNLPEPSGTCLRNLHHFTPELSGTCLRNLHQHTPELSGTFRNLPPEPAPATRTSTHRSLSGLKTPLAYAVGEKKKGCLSVPHPNNLNLSEHVFVRPPYEALRPSSTCDFFTFSSPLALDGLSCLWSFTQNWDKIGKSEFQATQQIPHTGADSTLWPFLLFICLSLLHLCFQLLHFFL